MPWLAAVTVSPTRLARPEEISILAGMARCRVSIGDAEGSVVKVLGVSTPP